MAIPVIFVKAIVLLIANAVVDKAAKRINDRIREADKVISEDENINQSSTFIAEVTGIPEDELTAEENKDSEEINVIERESEK